MNSKLLTQFVPFAVVAITAFGVSGCGKSLPKLTDDQKAALSDTLQSAGRGATAASNVGAASRTTTTHTPNSVLLRGLTGSLLATASTAPQRDDTELQFETKLRNAHDAHTCDVTATAPGSSDFGPSNPGNPAPTPGSGMSFNTNMNMTLKVAGQSCPMSLDIELSSQSSQSSMAMKIHGAFSVTDADLVKANDVSAFGFDGSITASASGSGADMSIDLKGSITSAKHGNVTITVSGSGNASQSGSKVDVVADFVFPDFEAKMEEKQDGDKTSYSINGEDVSAQEFAGYLSKAGVPSTTPGTTPIGG